ncbi:hypothetical protein [Evansella tamaricis]|uniref:Lipoprotein n=1 Tax=Evansella tamaricis TaxID=2069301 RepID=A0ABS6JAM9_9BACI|nr:hypothetical protein [Evansella tamaricis]MBU9710732.1 hypothetical protein [Evansella tamaricis]
MQHKLFKPLIFMMGLVTTLMLVACSGGDGSEDSSSGTDSESADRDEFFKVTWEGEEMEFDDIMCRPMGERFQKEVSQDDSDETATLLVGYPRAEDDDDIDYDFNRVSLVQLNINHGGETIGDGEVYSARSVDHIDGVEISGDGIYAKGTVELDARRNTLAEEINPEGGTIEFELSCG